MFNKEKRGYNYYLNLVENKEYFHDERKKEFEEKKEEVKKWFLAKLKDILKK